jgi:hypothetical protein
MSGQRFKFANSVLKRLMSSKIFCRSGHLGAIDLAFQAGGNAGGHALHIAGKFTELHQRCSQPFRCQQMLLQRNTIGVEPGKGEWRAGKWATRHRAMGALKLAD